MVPQAGDTIYVPNIKKGDCPGKAFDECNKRGGNAIVSRVTGGKQHYISVINFGGMELPWEGYLEDIQDELKKQIGNTQAGITN